MSLVMASRSYSGSQPHSSRAALSSMAFGQDSAIDWRTGYTSYSIVNSGMYLRISAASVSGVKWKEVTLKALRCCKRSGGAPCGCSE